MALGSIYIGALYYGSVTWLIEDLFEQVETRFVLSDNHTHFLLIYTTTIDNRDCILYALPLSRPRSLPAGTKTRAGGTRCCNWKRPTTHTR